MCLRKAAATVLLGLALGALTDCTKSCPEVAALQIVLDLDKGREGFRALDLLAKRAAVIKGVMAVESLVDAGFVRNVDETIEITPAAALLRKGAISAALINRQFPDLIAADGKFARVSVELASRQRRVPISQCEAGEESTIRKQIEKLTAKRFSSVRTWP